MHRLRPRVTYANVVSTLALVFALAGGSYAAVQSIPDKDGVINACFKKKGGAVRVVKGTKCRKGERRLAWSQRGRQGLRGLTGPTGPTGAAGKNGAPGVNGTNGATNVTTRLEIGPNTDGSAASVYCNSGERATGGGVNWRGTGLGYVDHSAPIDDSSDTPIGWSARIGNRDAPGTTTQALVYVICAAP